MQLVCSSVGRTLEENEEVHHLDSNRSNNSPDNLLILDKTQHAKLHSWLDKNFIIPKPAYALRKIRGCVRCAFCEKPINPSLKKFCSTDCMYSFNRDEMTKETSLEELTDLVNKLPLTKVAEILGISDRGVKKRCDRLGITINRNK